MGIVLKPKILTDKIINYLKTNTLYKYKFSSIKIRILSLMIYNAIYYYISKINYINYINSNITKKNYLMCK